MSKAMKREIAARKKHCRVLIAGVEVGDAEVVRVLHGPFPIPGREPGVDEPIVFQVMWFGPTTTPWPEGPPPAIQFVEDDGKNAVWLTGDAKAALDFVARWGLRFKPPRTEN